MTRLTKAGEVDGRSKRASGRTEQIATRVTAEVRDQIRAVAERDGILIGELMEKAVDAYEREHEGVMAMFAHAFELANLDQRLEMGKVISAWITANKAELKGTG